MAGIDAHTGRAMPDYDHLIQSIEKILVTRIGDRLMREWFGSPANRLLGENMNQQTFLRWWSIVWAALTIFEPRFKLKGMRVLKAERTGESEMRMIGEWRPYAHLDFQQAELFILLTRDGVVVRKAV